MTATIGDVARAADVSTATVSRVLAGLGGARPETRARILEAARELGYRPSAVARSLKLRTTRTLGLIITDIENPFFPQLVRTVEDVAREHGFALLLCNATEDPDREASYLDLLVDRRVDGVVIAVSGLGARHREWLAEPPLPVVLVNTVAPGLPHPSITSDNVDGGRQAGAHLLDLGHRRIGVLTAGPRNAAAPDRVAGVRRAFEERGLGADSLTVAVGEPGVGGGEAACDQLLAEAPGLTAVIAYNDLMAIGAMRAIRAAGLVVPRDISVVGFDDVAIAEYTDPPLTTIAQDIGDLGRWAVERLVEGIGAAAGDVSQAGIPTVTVLPVRLVARGSSGPAPDAAARVQAEAGASVAGSSGQ
ncbi:MAG TPA: LacI family DNA-binding transcriptional regulator [Methylomirabilota bacterium]|nr:LacI family DNA-binding transcriptional regulator [Methylomirabilota bacterium]